MKNTSIRTKSKVKALSLRTDIAEKIDLYAGKENRSVSNFVETVLIKYFKETEREKQD